MSRHTTIIMGEDKLHFSSGGKLHRMTKLEPKTEHFCALPGCTNLVTNYKNQVRDCCSGHHGRQLSADKAKMKVGLRDPFEIMEALKNHECSLRRTAEYFEVDRSVLRERMYEFKIKINKIVVMDEK